MTNLDSIFKSRDITFPTKVCLVKAMVFPVVMYGCESWTVKKAERRRMDAFELWCWRRLLRVPWMARRSNQSILKEISLECSLVGLMLKLELQYFGHLCKELTQWRGPWCWERLKAGGEGANRGWEGWMASPTLWTWVWASSRSLECCSPWGCSQTGLRDWTVTTRVWQEYDRNKTLCSYCNILGDTRFNFPIMDDTHFDHLAKERSTWLLHCEATVFSFVINITKE